VRVPRHTPGAFPASVRGSIPRSRAHRLTIARGVSALAPSLRTRMHPRIGVRGRLPDRCPGRAPGSASGAGSRIGVRGGLPDRRPGQAPGSVSGAGRSPVAKVVSPHPAPPASSRGLSSGDGLNPEGASDWPLPPRRSSPSPRPTAARDGAHSFPEGWQWAERSRHNRPLFGKGGCEWAPDLRLRSVRGDRGKRSMAECQRVGDKVRDGAEPQVSAAKQQFAAAESIAQSSHRGS